MIASGKVERHGLVVLTFGNVSGMDRDEGLIVIKPSGVGYADLTPEVMVVVDLKGKVVDGELRPSSDTPTHVVLYNAWPAIGGIVHAHSPYATMFAQACSGIPCFGTTHADHFYGEIPVTRALRKQEVERSYEAATGDVIVERFADLNPVEMPGVLVANHGPFAWGPDPNNALTNAVALEYTAGLALGTLQIAPGATPLPRHILDKHYSRKHGPAAYYGQRK